MPPEDEQSKERLPAEVEKFRKQKLSDANAKKLHDENVELYKIRNKDYDWRVKNRDKFALRVMRLLYAQHLFLFLFIITSYFRKDLCDYRWLIGSFFAGLMTQTFFTVNLIVKWLFTEIPYISFDFSVAED